LRAQRAARTLRLLAGKLRSPGAVPAALLCSGGVSTQMILKLGVTSLDEISRDRTPLGYPKRFALSLYAEILEAHPELDAWLPRILERHETSSGAVKRTSDRRFGDLDLRVEQRVAEMPRPAEEPLRVHDAGVSDGRSSVELFDRLRRFEPLDFVASDRDPRVDLVRGPQGRWSVAFDEEGTVVQYAAHGFVLSPVGRENALLYPVNRAVLAWLERRLRPRAEAIWRRAASPPLADLERRIVDDCVVWRVPLICRACLEHMKTGAIEFRRHDIRDPLPGPFHVVRAMNVLNHLDPPGQRRAVGSLWASLAEGGLLVAGRSVDPHGETRAAIWRRERGELRELDRLHGGAELGTVIRDAL